MQVDTPRNEEGLKEPVVVRKDRFLGTSRTGFLVGVILVLAVGLMTVSVFLSKKIGENRDLVQQTRALALQGKKAHDALCVAAKNSADDAKETRESAARTEKFLEEGGHLVGVPDSLLRQGLVTTKRTAKRQQRTADDLFRILGDCVGGS